MEPSSLLRLEDWKAGLQRGQMAAAAEEEAVEVFVVEVDVVAAAEEEEAFLEAWTGF